MKSLKSKKHKRIFSVVIISIMLITLTVLSSPILATDYKKVNEIVVGLQDGNNLEVETTSTNGSSDLKSAGDTEETESSLTSSDKTTTTLDDGTVVTTETITEHRDDGTTITEIIKELTQKGDLSYNITYTDPNGKKTNVEIDPEEIREFLDSGFEISGEDLTEALKGKLTSVVEGKVTEFLQDQLANISEDLPDNQITDYLTSALQKELPNIVSDVLSGELPDILSGNLEDKLSNMLENLSTDKLEDIVKDMSKTLAKDIFTNIASDVISDILPDSISDTVVDMIVDKISNTTIDDIKNMINTVTNITPEQIKDSLTDIAIDLANEGLTNLKNNITDKINDVISSILPDDSFDISLDLGNIGKIDIELGITGGSTDSGGSTGDGSTGTGESTGGSGNAGNSTVVDTETGEILKIERNEDGTFKIAQLEDSSKKFAHPTTGMIMDNDSGKVSGSTSPNIVTGYEIKKYTSATDGVQSGDGTTMPTGEPGMAKSTATIILYCSEHGAKFEALAGELTYEEASKYGYYYGNPLFGQWKHQGDANQSVGFGTKNPDIVLGDLDMLLDLITGGDANSILDFITNSIGSIVQGGGIGAFPLHIENWEENNGERTYPFLHCTNDHYDMTDKSGSQYHPDMAYILTYPTFGEWDVKKQNAVWFTDYGKQKGKSTGIQEGSRDLYEEALKYEEFHDKMEEAKEADQEELSVMPENKTDYDKLRVYADYDSQKLTIGPYSIDYICGVYEEVTFGGISDMYFIGLNSDDEVVKEKIEIEKYIYNDEELDLKFFEPETSDKSYISREEQVYPKGVSAGEEEFYVRIENPNDGVTTDAERVSKLVLHIDFKWMTAGADICEMVGYVYEVEWKSNPIIQSSTPIPIKEILAAFGIIIPVDFYEHTGYNKDYSRLKPLEVQDHFALLNIERVLHATSLEIGLEMDGGTPPTDVPPTDVPPGINITMKLGGYVWEETLSGKETLADGVSTTEGDRRYKNIKVSLYDEDGNLVELSATDEMEGGTEESVYHKINPTYTDEEGRYLFLGLDPLKKYYVVFEYNGQRYLPTDYNMNIDAYNTEEWEVTSKATEAESAGTEGIEIGRDEYDQRFQEISAYPHNYPSSNSMGAGSENAAYSQLDLMGYELTENGTYSKSKTQWVDGYEFDENGLETDEWTEGEVSKKIREFIESNEAYPSDDDMKSIYSSIDGSEEGTRIAQFLEDSAIQAYTAAQGAGEPDLYPVYEQFVINESEEDRKAEDPWSVDYDTSSITIAGKEFKPIYPGQLYINLGLWRRQEFDAALRKDIYKAALKINDKTVIYTYEKRAEEEEGANNAEGDDNNTYWDINVRMSDYEAYYNSGYNREIYETDYNYDSAQMGHPGTDLEIYVTYKITVRNQSMSVMTQIKEIVDYYDQDYTFKPNLSWVTYMSSGNLNVGVNKDQYYEMMDQDQEVIDAESTKATQFIKNGQDANVTEGSSRYGDEKNLGSGYQNLYVRGLENKTLATGESAYIYLTFEVNKEGNRVILDDESSPKENIAEINGFVTYYADGTQLPNGISEGSGDIAGLLDRDSNPGNLECKDIHGSKYEKNFEDDTDRAPSIRVLIDPEAIRKVNGTVWEDERTEASGDAVIGDGIRQDDEIGISGVTVQLVEKCVDGSEYIWQETTTDGEGKYNFEEYIPGDYVIRFYYGDTEATVVPSDGQETSYNGQDFKSTTYQEGIDQNGQTDIDGRYQGYINTATQNVSGTYNPNVGAPTEDTYGYDIYKADSDSTNYSDAKDIWTSSNREGINIIGPVSSAREVAGRDRVIEYSKENVTNHIAEVLASPYSGDSSLYGELMDNTYMTAETGVIVVEFEYDRQQSEGDKEEENNSSNSSKDYVDPGNRHNSTYELKNVDFGIEERPKSQLEIDKSVSNVKVTLANNSILFDINEAANNALWQDHKEYNVDEEMKDGMYEEYYGKDGKDRYSFRDEIADIVQSTDKGLIQLTMDEELMHGATIQVTYTIKVTNVGETDYVDGDNKNFYYKGDTSGAHVSKTTTNQVVDYVQNNLQFAANNETNSGDGWSVISGADLLGGDLVNARLTESVSKFNTIIQTESFATDLEPGGEVTKTLVLSQLITPENTEDDLQYTNMAEIVKTSNENGRRMAFSVVGNQDPMLDNPSEIDASMAERIIILTPFGENNFFYMIAGIVAVILVIGIVLIKAFVLKKKK